MLAYAQVRRAAACEVGTRESNDSRDRHSVQQREGPRHPHIQGQRLVMQAASQVRPVLGLAPPAVGFIAGAVADLKISGETTLVGPAQEQPDMSAIPVLRQPRVDVTLSQVGERYVVGVQPGEKRGSAANGAAYRCRAGRREATSCRPSPGPSQEGPFCVDVQGAAVLRGERRERALQPGLQACQGLIAWRKDTEVDEGGTQRRRPLSGVGWPELTVLDWSLEPATLTPAST